MANDKDRPSMERVYDSEIDASIEWLCDGGFRRGTAIPVMVRRKSAET
jgi:hypothetical protein